jgi:hypothetical protein
MWLTGPELSPFTERTLWMLKKEHGRGDDTQGVRPLQWIELVQVRRCGRSLMPSMRVDTSSGEIYDAAAARGEMMRHGDAEGRSIKADSPFKHYRISYWKPLMKAMVRR